MTTSNTTSMPARIVAALLCVAVAVVHVIDQDGIPGSKTPAYVGVGYWVLELVGVLTAVALLIGWRPAWFVAIGVAGGPLVGYVLSRGPGLPDYDDDRGNWTEPLGLISLAIEGVLLIIAIAMFLRRQGTSAAVTERVPDGAGAEA